MVGGGHHGECGARAYNGGLGQSPQRGPGTEPLVRGSRGRSPPEAESIFVIGCPTEPANLAPVRENSMLCYGPLVSELGGPRVHGAPTPSLGACASRPPGSAAYDRIVSVTAADMSPGWMCRMWIRSCSWVVSVIIVYGSFVFADDELQLSGPDRRRLRAPGELTNYVIASVTCLSVLPSVRPPVSSCVCTMQPVV